MANKIWAVVANKEISEIKKTFTKEMEKEFDKYIAYLQQRVSSESPNESDDAAGLGKFDLCGKYYEAAYLIMELTFFTVLSFISFIEISKEEYDSEDYKYLKD